MRRISWLVLLLAATFGPASAQNESIAELRKMFDYDQNAPLDIKEVGVINRKGVRVLDITYASPKHGRVTAYLVMPTASGRFAGIVFGHWGYGTRTEFLPEAILYAQAGVEGRLAFERRIKGKSKLVRTVGIHNVDFAIAVSLRHKSDFFLRRQCCWD